MRSGHTWTNPRGLFIITTLLLPAPLLANAGTPFMLAVGIQIYFFNLVIALLEAGLIRWVYDGKTGIIKSWLAMVGANLISLIVGVVMQAVAANLLDIPYKPFSYLPWQESYYVTTLLLVSYPLSVLLELPIIKQMLPVGTTWGRAFKITMIVHVASYALLLAYYAVMLK